MEDQQQSHTVPTLHWLSKSLKCAPGFNTKYFIVPLFSLSVEIKIRPSSNSSKRHSSNDRNGRIAFTTRTFSYDFNPVSCLRPDSHLIFSCLLLSLTANPCNFSARRVSLAKRNNSEMLMLNNSASVKSSLTGIIFDVSTNSFCTKP
uniref:CSON014154 protein n=1 Tax=Culicoides sonorensis TaxID=179676 RepID=A0A336MCK9_CULSO